MFVKLLKKENLTLNEIITIIIYCLISLAILLVFIYSNNIELKKTILSFYSSSTVLFLYIFGYKSLRKMIFTQIWIFISLMHLTFFLLTKDKTDLFYKRGSAVNIFGYTIIAVILIQLFRFISLKIQKKELVCPSRNGIDMFDNRKTNFFDTIFFLFYILAFVGYIIITSE